VDGCCGPHIQQQIVTPLQTAYPMIKADKKGEMVKKNAKCYQKILLQMIK
jgi:hypothetical protein